MIVPLLTAATPMFSEASRAGSRSASMYLTSSWGEALAYSFEKRSQHRVGAVARVDGDDLNRVGEPGEHLAGLVGQREDLPCRHIESPGNAVGNQGREDDDRDDQTPRDGRGEQEAPLLRGMLSGPEVPRCCVVFIMYFVMRSACGRG